MCGKLWQTKHIRLPGAAPCYCNTATSLGTLVHSSCAPKEICHAARDLITKLLIIRSPDYNHL